MAKALNGLLLSVFEDFEVVLRELGDEPALSVADGDADVNEVHGAPEYRDLSRRHQGHEGNKGHKGHNRHSEYAARRPPPLCPL
jgi:hypothetical protein